MDVLVEYSYTCQHDGLLFFLSFFSYFLAPSLPTRLAPRLLFASISSVTSDRFHVPPAFLDDYVLGEADDKNRIGGQASFCRCVERLALATSSPSALFKNAARLCQFLRRILAFEILCADHRFRNNRIRIIRLPLVLLFLRKIYKFTKCPLIP